MLLYQDKNGLPKPLIKNAFVKMEKNFYRDQFEQMLKDTTDSFRMYPSRKIWHSIYNDLHPAKKWPSFAVLLLLTASIMYIGVTNPDRPTIASQSKRIAEKDLLASANKNRIAINRSSASPKNIAEQSSGSASPVSIHNSYTAVISSLNINDGDGEEKYTSTNRGRSNQFQTTAISRISISQDNNSKENDITNTSNNNVSDINSNTTDIIPSGEDALASAEASSQQSKNIVTDLIPSAKKDNAELSWKEDMAFYNSKNKSSKQKWYYQVYATPSVGFRTLAEKSTFSESGRSALVLQPDQNDYSINHSPAMNLEAGGNIIYSLTKKLRIKAGLQFNYTNYLISAYTLNHPVASKLVLTDQNSVLPSVVTHSTMISNSQSLADTYLDNNTYQFSIPVGADFQIIGNKKIKWFAGATVQPTYISGGTPYLISSDLKNYINDPSLLRKFNMNGAVETFVSFEMKNGVQLSAGPQFRYQFFSTYSDRYSYSEKLYNVGIKFGITSKL